MKKFYNSLVFKLIVGIILGIIIGSFLPEEVVRIFVTFSTIFSSFLKFIIPFIILGFVVCGIADLTGNAGRLLAFTTALSYGSTILVGLFAYFVSKLLFPLFISSSASSVVGNPEEGMVSPYFSIPLEPMIEVTSAIVFAFIIGIGISYLRNSNKGDVLYRAFNEFQEIIKGVLEKIIIPFLPLYIIGTFANITISGQIVSIATIFSKVFLTIFVLHWIVIFIQFLGASIVSKKNPITLIKNQIPGYVTAVGTQSSATTIPVNINCAKKNGVSRSIREFVIPLCSTIHLSGSITSLLCFSVAILMMNDMNSSFSVILPFILMIGVAMVAAPGAPGGGVMAALPFLPMIGIASDSALASLMIALYITQDSLGTAANVSGDNAIALIVDTYNKKISS